MMLRNRLLLLGALVLSACVITAADEPAAVAASRAPRAPRGLGRL